MGHANELILISAFSFESGGNKSTTEGLASNCEY